MSEESQEVLRTLVFSEKQVAATDEIRFSMCVMPCRTRKDIIAGLVSTFSDITGFKEQEAGLRKVNARFKSPV